MLIERASELITRNTIVVLLVLLVMSLSKAPASEYENLDPLLTDHYAQTAWPTIHRDSCNSASVPFDGSDSLMINWTALDKLRVLCSVTMGPEGNRYVTTGKGSRRFHLHAFNMELFILQKASSKVT